MKKITDIKLILIILGVLGLFILLSLVLKIDQSRRGLASLKAELIAQGERLEWSQLVSNPPADVSNGWEVLLGTASAVPDLPRGEAPLTIYCSPGIRVPSHRIDTLPTELRWSKGRRTWTRNVWAELEASIDGTRHLRDSLRDAIAHDVIFADLDWSRGYSLTLPNLTIIRRLAQWNSLIVALDLRSGDLKAAMQAQTEGFRMMGKYRDEPSIISQIVRGVMVNMLAHQTWAILQHGWRDEQLSKLQEAIVGVHLAKPMLEAFEMERAMVILNWQNCVTDRKYGRGFLATGGRIGSVDFVDGVKYDAWRFFAASDDLRWYLRKRLPALTNAREAIRSRSYARLTSLNSRHPAASPPSQMLFSTRAWFDVTKPVLRMMKAETRLRLQVTAIALHRFKLRHGAYPATLKELLPNLLDELPLDWMDGQPLRYEKLSDQEFRLWSVGSDGIDQGGDPSSVKPIKDYRWDSGNDWLWPRSASAEEIREYEEAQIAEWRKATGGGSP